MKFISVPDDDPRAEFEAIYAYGFGVHRHIIQKVKPKPIVTEGDVKWKVSFERIEPKEKTNAEIVRERVWPPGSGTWTSAEVVNLLDEVDAKIAKALAELKGDG